MIHSRTFSTLFRRLVWVFLLIPATICSQNADIEILRSIHSSETLPTDQYFSFVSDTYSGVSIGVPLTLGIVGLITDNDEMFENSLEIAASTAISLGSTFILKYVTDRKRPYITYPDITNKEEQSSSSFPSNHTSAAFATATSLSLNYPKWYIIVPSYLWAGTVGYSRMYLGVHYPSDVLAGAVLGAGSAWLTHKANKWLQSTYKKKYVHQK